MFAQEGAIVASPAPQQAAPAPTIQAPGGTSSPLAPGLPTTLAGPQQQIQDANTQQLESDKQQAQQSESAPTRQVRMSPGAISEYQRFVAQTIGRPLNVFGYDLFNDPTTFAPVNDVPVPDDYVIGPGDQLELRVWGQFDYAAAQRVDRNGAIYLPKVGPVVVSGIRYEQLSNHLHQSLSRMFKNFELTANLGQLRTIQVFITGFARRPGVYTVSSLSTLVNALFASGGPSYAGSLRRTELRRGGKLVTTFDVYDLLLRGDISKDVKLQPGDIIYIPPVGNLVALPSEVKVPGIYELRGETSIADAIEIAGGFSTTAFVHEVTVESIARRAARSIERFPLDSAGLAKKVQDGDLLILTSISPKFENAVTLRGSVARPGRYPFVSGMTVRDLIPSRNALVSADYWQRVNASSGKISEGGIRNDVWAEMVDINWDYALIERISVQEMTTLLIPFNLGKAINDGDPKENHELQPGDIVTIFSQKDFRVPVSKQVKFVSVEGEFKTAGLYRIQPSETLPELVNRIGGVTAESYPEGIELLRPSVAASQRKKLDDFIRRMESDIERTALNTPTSSTDRGGEDFRARIELQRQFLSRLKAVTPTGRISMQVRQKTDGSFTLPPIALEDGDRVIMPVKPSTVSVVGMVYSSGDFLFNPKSKVADYIKMAGGTSRFADTGKTFILGVDGTVRPSSGGWFVGQSPSVRAGDTIIIPEQANPGAFMRGLRDWTAILAQFGISAAAVKVLSE